MPSVILVTGGAGFIGSHLVARLAQAGHRVVCLDNFDDFYPESIKRANLSCAVSSGQVRPVFADIRDADSLRRLFVEEDFQVVVHLAARPGVRPSLENPGIYLEINGEGTLNLLSVCREYDVQRFMLASSSSVYGSVEGAAREDRTPCRPFSPYGASKVAAEAIACAYALAFGMTVIALRFFTVYGPRQRPDMAICRFTRLIANGEGVPIYGDGSVRRDFTYVTDIIKGIEAAVDVPLQGFHAFNLGRGRPVSLLEMVGLIEERLGLRARLQFLPRQPGDLDITCADISKACSVLGYDPTIPMEEGIDLYVRWFRERQGTQAGKGVI